MRRSCKDTTCRLMRMQERNPPAEEQGGKSTRRVRLLHGRSNFWEGRPRVRPKTIAAAACAAQKCKLATAQSTLFLSTLIYCTVRRLVRQDSNWLNLIKLCVLVIIPFPYDFHHHLLILFAQPFSWQSALAANRINPSKDSPSSSSSFPRPPFPLSAFSFVVTTAFRHCLYSSLTNWIVQSDDWHCAREYVGLKYTGRLRSVGCCCELVAIESTMTQLLI